VRENRIDQRMPLELVTHSLLPSKKAQGNKFKKRRCSRRKPDGNGWDKTGAVTQV